MSSGDISLWCLHSYSVSDKCIHSFKDLIKTFIYKKYIFTKEGLWDLLRGGILYPPLLSWQGSRHWNQYWSWQPASATDTPGPAVAANVDCSGFRTWSSCWLPTTTSVGLREAAVILMFQYWAHSGSQHPLLQWQDPQWLLTSFAVASPAVAVAQSSLSTNTYWLLESTIILVLLCVAGWSGYLKWFVFTLTYIVMGKGS